MVRVALLIITFLLAWTALFCITPPGRMYTREEMPRIIERFNEQYNCQINDPHLTGCLRNMQ